MLACMITPWAGEPGGAATVKRPARPRGVWFGGTDTKASRRDGSEADPERAPTPEAETP